MNFPKINKMQGLTKKIIFSADSSTDSSNFATNGISHLVSLQKPSPLGGPIISSAGLRVGVSTGVSVSNPIPHLSPPTQAHMNLGN
jgi:hypothetical protein